jgi:hypothetical protein
MPTGGVHSVLNAPLERLTVAIVVKPASAAALYSKRTCWTLAPPTAS